MIVGSHFHDWSADAACAEDRGYLPRVAKPVEDGRDVQRHRGVARGVLIRPSFLGTDNRYLLSCFAAYPERLLAAFGSDRVVRAGDYPWTKHEHGRSSGELLDTLADCIPDAEIRRAILGVNAARLFRFPEGEAKVGSVAE